MACLVESQIGFLFHLESYVSYSFWFRIEMFNTKLVVISFRLWYFNDGGLELVSKELNHLAAILHVYAGGLNFMK